MYDGGAVDPLRDVYAIELLAWWSRVAFRKKRCGPSIFGLA